MRTSRHPLAALLVVCCALVACGSDKPAATAPQPTSAAGQSPSDTSGAAATQPVAPAGNVDCDSLKTNLADILVNWQVVIGLANSPTSEWATIPIGTLSKFGDQVAAVKAALGSDADAAAALTFMSGANDIVVRGIGGDTAAQADLVTYMGTDVSASISKQLPISMAYSNVGCK